MTPYEIVQASAHPLPFPLYPFQEEDVNALAHDDDGLWLEAGLGKTATSTAIALYKLVTNEVDHVLVLVPPILIRGWKRWLDKIPKITSMEYRGTPAQRAKLDPTKVQFTIMSLNIFKRDYERIYELMHHRRVSVLVDEAQALKNVSSQNYKLVRDFCVGHHHIQLLSGTPVTTPVDVYAYSKLLGTGAYKTLAQFENLHVGARDFFGNILTWKNLDLLAENLRIKSTRRLKEEVMRDLPSVSYTPIFHELEPDHHKLYQKLADEQLLRLGNGDKIDATQTTALYHALQQIIVNYDYFSGKDTNRSATLDVLEETLDELGEGKLVVFTNYRMTNAMLTKALEKYNARFIWGGSNQKETQNSLDAFINDPSVRVIVLQVRAGGVGVDGLQNVCTDVLFLEMPITAPSFHQAVARVHRIGQTKPVNVRIAVAERTISMRLFKNLMEKDALVNRVIRNYQDLKDAICGN